MNKEKLQAIIDNCEHPWSKQFFENLFSKHEAIMESLNARAENHIVEDVDHVSLNDLILDYTWDEEEQLDELDASTLDSYKDKANSQLRRGTYASKFTKPALAA